VAHIDSDRRLHRRTRRRHGLGVRRFAASGEDAEGTIETTGAILAGRRTYEVGRRDVGKASGEAYGGAWSGPQFVLTHHPPADGVDVTVTFLSGDIGEAVSTALEAAGRGNLEVLGADVARQCLERGLVDELAVHILPVLLGDGTRLFGDPPASRIDLEPISIERIGPTALARDRIESARWGHA
jgi:dihydrofolate reductase